MRYSIPNSRSLPRSNMLLFFISRYIYSRTGNVVRFDIALQTVFTAFLKIPKLTDNFHYPLLCYLLYIYIYIFIK